MRENVRFLAQNARISHHAETGSMNSLLVVTRRLLESRSRKAVPVYWDREPRNPNFGDELTPVLVEKLLGRQASWSMVDRTCLLGAGSILECLRGSHVNHRGDSTRVVAGAGFMWEDSSGWPANTRLVSVRGHLSRARLGKGASTVSVGDPGLLMSVAFPQPELPGRTDTRILFIPHYADAADAIVTRLRSKWPNCETASTSEHPARLAARIASASIVVSSALHPLVVADSYGVPNAWLKLSNRVHGEGFKFRDYASVFDFQPTPETPDSLETNPAAWIDRVMEGYSRPYIGEVLRDVARSFFEAIDELDELRK